MIAFFLSFPVLFLLAGIAAAVYYSFKRRPGQDGTPPGPMGIPFLGYLPFLGSYPWQTLQKMQDKYPHLIAFDMGRIYTVVLQDYDAIKAVFIDQDEATIGRPQDFMEGLKYFSAGKDGKTHAVIMLEGPKWKATHSFCKGTFEDLGLGEQRMDNIINTQADNMATAFRSQKGAFDPEEYIYAGTVNILTHVMRGKPLEYDGPEFKKLLAKAEKTFETLAVGLVNQYPMLKHVPGPTKDGWDSVEYTTENAWNFFEKEVVEHEQSFNEAELRDFIDAYLLHSSSGEDSIAMQNKDDLITSMIACWAAGSEATCVATLWAIYFMCQNPDIQQRVHDEIDSKIGRNRFITSADRDLLPFTQAAMYESLRLGANAPLGNPRRNFEEINAMGYRIPRHTQILPNVWAIHRNAKYFPSPDSYKPDRFVQDGRFVLPPQFMIFGIGLRSCPGINLAQSILFLVFANLMAQTEFRTARGTTLPSDQEARLGISCRPLNYKIEVTARR